MRSWAIKRAFVDLYFNACTGRQATALNPIESSLCAASCALSKSSKIPKTESPLPLFPSIHCLYYIITKIREKYHFFVFIA
jgi:hypothetical protein